MTFLRADAPGVRADARAGRVARVTRGLNTDDLYDTPGRAGRTRAGYRLRPSSYRARSSLLPLWADGTCPPTASCSSRLDEPAPWPCPG